MYLYKWQKSFKTIMYYQACTNVWSKAMSCHHYEYKGKTEEEKVMEVSSASIPNPVNHIIS